MDFLFLAAVALMFVAAVGLVLGLRSSGSAQMTWLYVVSGLVAVGLLVYLLVALFNAEDL